ncbi:MAG: carbohydrate-binding family 9-like protein [Clostridiales bacterium]|jgi:hypothetical protein|nr:carbohydrate-binding family 9-like protein [Clostridiales bacterium]
MRQIIIPTTPRFSEKPQGVISLYKWSGNGYAPRVDIFLTADGQKLFVKFEVYERAAAVKYPSDGQPVYNDSAVEFFLKPFDDDPRYLNFEFNAVCAAVLGFGEGKTGRAELIERFKKTLNASVVTESQKWRLCFEIPAEIIGSVYGRRFSFYGRSMTGNFYKCGDQTAYPHFGMLFDVESLTPDFHKPESFGRLKIVKD